MERAAYLITRVAQGRRPLSQVDLTTSGQVPLTLSPGAISLATRRSRPVASRVSPGNRTRSGRHSVSPAEVIVSPVLAATIRSAPLAPSGVPSVSFSVGLVAIKSMMWTVSASFS